MQQQNMDSQFSLDSVIGLDEVFARRSNAAKDALTRYRHARGISYGDRPGQTLNIFYPETGATPAPVQFFIHGGFWRSLDADLFSFLAPGFVPFGAMLVVIDYPLMPTVRMAEDRKSVV